MLIDTHCHLTFPEFDVDRIAIIGNAKKAGIKQFIVPGVDFYSSQLATALAKTQPKTLFAAIGYHPYEAQELPEVNHLTTLLCPEVVAIGECGLDYHLYKDEIAMSKKTNQIRLFREQIEFSIQHSLPLIMHCRDAFDDFFNTLEAYRGQIRGVLHCFSGGLQDVRTAIDIGLYLGFDGNVTFSKHLQMILPHVPVGSLLLETDSPYLTPIPFRGKRNQPKYLVHTADVAATILNLSRNQLDEATSHNARRLFTLPEIKNRV